MLRKQFNFGLSFGFRGEYHGNCSRTSSDGRRGHGHPISSLFEPKGSFELKIGIPMHTKVLLYKGVVHLLWFRTWYSRTRYPDMDNRPCSR